MKKISLLESSIRGCADKKEEAKRKETKRDFNKLKKCLPLDECFWPEEYFVSKKVGSIADELKKGEYLLQDAIDIHIENNFSNLLGKFKDGLNVIANNQTEQFSAFVISESHLLNDLAKQFHLEVASSLRLLFSQVAKEIALRPLRYSFPKLEALEALKVNIGKELLQMVQVCLREARITQTKRKYDLAYEILFSTIDSNLESQCIALSRNLIIVENLKHLSHYHFDRVHLNHMESALNELCFLLDSQEADIYKDKTEMFLKEVYVRALYRSIEKILAGQLNGVDLETLNQKFGHLLRIDKSSFTLASKLAWQVFVAEPEKKIRQAIEKVDDRYHKIVKQAMDTIEKMSSVRNCFSDKELVTETIKRIKASIIEHEEQKREKDVYKYKVILASKWENAKFAIKTYANAHYSVIHRLNLTSLTVNVALQELAKHIKELLPLIEMINELDKSIAQEETHYRFPQDQALKEIKTHLNADLKTYFIAMSRLARALEILKEIQKALVGSTKEDEIAKLNHLYVTLSELDTTLFLTACDYARKELIEEVERKLALELLTVDAHYSSRIKFLIDQIKRTSKLPACFQDPNELERIWTRLIKLIEDRELARRGHDVEKFHAHLMNRSEEMERAVNSFCENHFSQLSQLSLASSTVEANLFQLTSMVKQVGLFQQVWNDLDETIRHQQNHYFLPLKEDLLVEMHEFHRNHLNGFFKEVSIRSKMRLIDNQLTLLEAQIEQVMQKEYTKLSQRLLEINELPRLIQYGFSRLVVETIASTLESLKGLSLPEGETQEIKVLNFLNTILTLSSEMNKERKIEFLTTSIQELLNNKPEENLILLNSHFEKLFQLDLKEFKRCRDNVMEVLISQTRSELDAALQTQQDNDCCNSSEIQKYIVRGEGILQLPACFKNGAESEALVASIKERLRLHEIRQRAREIQFYELLLPTFVLQTIEKIRLENFKQFEKILSLKLDVSDVEGSLNKLGPVAGIIEFVNIWKQLCRAILTEKQRYSLIADEDLIKIKNDFEVILKKDLANILIMAQGLNLVKQYEKELDNLKREVEEVIKKNPALIVTKGIKIEAGINARVIKALEQNKIEWQKLEASASHDMKGELSMLRKEVEDKENILNQYMFSEADKKNLASIVSAITQACIKDELSMIIDQLPDMLATLYNHKELHNKAIGELISNLNRQQNPVDIHNYLVSENYTAIINIYALLTKAQNLLKEHFSLDIAQLVKTTCVHIDSLQNEALQEINSSAFSTSFFELRKLRSFCNVLTALTNLKLTKSSADVLRSFRNIVKERWNIYVNDLPRNTAILSPEAKRNLVSGITQELIKQQEVATQLSLLSDYKTYMSRALKLLQKDLIVQMGTLLAEYALKEDPFISGSAKGVLATFSDFRSVDRSYWQEKASVTFEEALPKLTSLPVLDIGSQDRIRQAYHIYNQAYNEYINLIHFKKFQKDQHITETRKLAAKINPESFYFNLKEVSELLASICALWTFLDADTDAFSLVDSRFLIQPHSTQILTILSLIGVAQPGKIANHLAQVGTGEGKSISLGILSTLFALVGYDVSVVCYSSYLSKRDRKLFSNLFGQFGVEQKIQYCTIKKLMEAQLNASLPDFRGQAQSFLRGETVVPFIQKVVKKSLLLIDEVDVFFGEFYGRLHGSLVSVISPAVEELIRYIWEQRNDLKQLDNKKALNLLKSLTCSKNILREFPNLSPFFLGELTKMFEVATNFPGEPIHSRYRIKQDQIYYIDDAGNLNPFIKDGYHTAFAYLYNFDQGLIRNKERVSQELVIYLKCSDVLYSEIPKNYSLRLGLTATLSGLSKGENLVLNDYKFTKRSFIPSTFKKKPITRGETLVFSGERNKEYFEAIKNDIFQIVSQGRASLVVFDTLEYLDAFRDYLTRVQRKVDHYFEAEVLSEAVSDSEKAAVVLKSINQYRTTFITRRYGRGTDFVCRNSALEKCGGVHVILTFFPETLTEEEQIFGRTGRQDNPGTVRYILFAGDLLAQKFVPARIQDGAEIPDLSSIDCSFSLSSSPKPDWDGYLNKERKKKDAIRYKAIMAYLAKNKEIHQQSLQLSKAMERSDKNVVMKILSEWNKE